MTHLNRNALWKWLDSCGQSDWSELLKLTCDQRFRIDGHGTMKQWMGAYEKLPSPDSARLETASGIIQVRTREPASVDDVDKLRETLMQFHPWRKGPFTFLDLEIDTEWRSDLKWDRIAEQIDFVGKSVLDVGCGNGYYGWRMLDAGADFVLGCDPFLLYVMQFEVFRRYARTPHNHFVVPLTDQELPSKLQLFDLVFSMGVLYHRTSPIDHLQKLASCLRPNGQLVLETLIIEDDSEQVLVPEGRYAKMRNVWFIPSIPMLQRWLVRTGFRNIEVVDVSTTTSMEQRRTEWMTFESLDDFLDPEDPTKSIEGYPAPRRAVLTARLKS